MTLHPVLLVGAGPGAVDLLTLRAARAIQDADVILVDDLVEPAVLELAQAKARVLSVGKRGGCVSTDQAFIHTLMVREARRGARVVRLKGGDPFMFGRGGEELDALRAAGLAVEVVPGITSGMAAPASLGVPVTDRRHAPGVAMVTGHGREGGRPIDWTALARSGLTLVIYMGVARSQALQQELLAAGLVASTPVAVIAKASTPAQRQALTTLGRLADTIQTEALESPAIIVVGEVVQVADATTWMPCMTGVLDASQSCTG